MAGQGSVMETEERRESVKRKKVKYDFQVPELCDWLVTNLAYNNSRKSWYLAYIVLKKDIALIKL